MLLSELLIALLIGMLFGFVLDKGGLNRYHKIANVFRFTDLTVLRFMMSGMLVGMVGVYTLRYLGLLELTNVAPSVLARQLVGGAVFGVGMALAGFCPGTCVAGAARGQLDYLIPGLLGFLTGGVIYGLIYPTPVVRWLMTNGALDEAYAKLPEILQVDPMLLVFVFAEAIFLFLYVVNKTNARRRDALIASEAPAAPIVPSLQAEGAGD
jgi:uncharacterized membrane protein YedE/YeeE